MTNSRWRKVKQSKAWSNEKKILEPVKSLQCALILLRLKALIVDTFMITMPILYVVIYLVMGDREGFKEHMGQGWLIILVVHMTITIAFWKLKTQTPGMKAYDLYLVDQQTDVQHSIIKLIVRYVMLQVSILSFFGIFLPLIIKNKKGLHDLISGTCIIYKP